MGDLVLERFQRLNALNEHGVDRMQTEQTCLELQVHNGRTDLPDVQTHLEHVERTKHGLLAQRDSAGVFGRRLRFVRQIVLGEPLMIVQPIYQIVQPFVTGDRRTVDYAATMNRVQMARVCAVLRYLLKVT